MQSLVIINSIPQYLQKIPDLKNRSIRRFFQDNAIEIETIKELVELARLSASGANLQPILLF